MKRESLLQRRGFLGQLTALGLVGLAGAGNLLCLLSSGPKPGPQTGLSLEKATCADFAPCLGSWFQIGAEPGKRFKVKLVQAQELRSVSPRGAGMRQPFSLVFRAPAASGLTARIYQAEHSQLGTFPVYLGPVNRPASEVCLEAIFS